MYGNRRKVHFVGVGGIGMSGLAEILLNLDYAVSGSDIAASDITRRLASLGLEFFEGHAAGNAADAEVLVRSSAVTEENVEVAAALERGVPVLHRSDVLADLMRLKPHAVAVGGTHGKTTTTSMISSILDGANMGATSIVGGILHRSGTNARRGKGDYLVAEADEHDGSFLRLSPTIAVVTNIDAEHLEYYGTLDRIQQAFVDFCNSVPFYGYAIVCGDDPNTAAVLGRIHTVCLAYGLGDGVALQATNIELVTPDPAQPTAAQLGKIRTRFDVVSHDDRLPRTGRLGRVEIQALGDHNVRNALAACAVGLCLGLRFPLVATGLATYEGVRRRLQVCGQHDGITVVEDYAHHPTELRETLAAVRLAEPRRIICIFQPHLYSRTKFFCDEFAEALCAVDRAIVTAIYPSREEPMPGVTAGLVVDAARARGGEHVQLIEDMHAVPERLAPELEEGDLVLVLGAGNIDRIAPKLLATLEATVRA